MSKNNGGLGKARNSKRRKIFQIAKSYKPVLFSHQIWKFWL